MIVPAPTTAAPPTGAPRAAALARCPCGRIAERVCIDVPDTLPPELPPDPLAAVLRCRGACSHGYAWAWPADPRDPADETRGRALMRAHAHLRGLTREDPTR